MLCFCTSRTSGLAFFHCTLPGGRTVSWRGVGRAAGGAEGCRKRSCFCFQLHVTPEHLHICCQGDISIQYKTGGGQVLRGCPWLALLPMYGKPLCLFAYSLAPCPFLSFRGLILQDLTFVHLGNPDYIDSKVNFSKRWQQFNILDSMRCFQQV